MVLSIIFGVYRYRKASIDSIDKFVVCTLLSLLIKQNVSVSVNVSFYKVYRGLTVTS